MARGPKTRFLEHAIENGLDSAAATFPAAFTAEEIAELTALAEPQRKERLQKLFDHYQEIDKGFDG